MSCRRVNFNESPVLTDRSKFSFTRMILAGFVGITLSTVVVLGWQIYRSQTHGEIHSQGEFQLHTGHIATVLSVEIANLHKLTEQIARNPELLNLLSFGDPLEIQAWTIRTRELIPDTVGMAIFDQAGNLYGNSAPQRIGQRCRADARKLIYEMPTLTLPFHGDNGDFRHFDIVSPIEIKGIPSNFLLISFRASLLENRIRQMTAWDASYVLYNSNGEALVEVGANPGNGAYRDRRAVPGSDWVLEANSDLAHNLEFSRQSWGIFTLFAVGTFLVAIFFTLFLRRRLEEDMHILKRQMAIIHDSKFDDTVALGNRGTQPVHHRAIEEHIEADRRTGKASAPRPADRLAQPARAGRIRIALVIPCAPRLQYQHNAPRSRRLQKHQRLARP